MSTGRRCRSAPERGVPDRTGPGRRVIRPYSAQKAFSHRLSWPRLLADLLGRGEGPNQIRDLDSVEWS